MNYISEEIGLDYINWGRRKIILHAPTGAGKTTFILEKLLPFTQQTKGHGVRPDKKVLILCNRKLLRKQYIYDAALKFKRYKEMEEALEIKTYQELARALQQGERPENLFTRYAVICLDEVHYFYADSDFNGMGTYSLFQAIIMAGLGKEMIFISATIDCVLPFIQKTTFMCRTYMLDRHNEIGIYSSRIFDAECKEFLSPVPYRDRSYDFLNCFCVRDRKTLCQKIAESEGKSIIFIDDKKWVEQFSEELEMAGMRAKEICKLNAEILDNDESNVVIKNLVLANRLLPKVLITTSVLDNGVSIKDSGAENIVILTESEVSFKQMLGRIRHEYIRDKVNLFFLLRPAEYFEMREIQCRKFLDVYEEIKLKTLERCLPEILSKLFSCKDDEMKSIYRKMIIAVPDYLAIDQSPEMRRLSCRKGNLVFLVNPLAVQKIGDLYLQESRFHKLARMDLINVPIEQLKWIGLTQNDLQILNSSYFEEKEKRFIEKLLSMKDFTNEEYSKFKEEINQEYGKDFFRDIVEKKGSFSKEKLKLILEKYGCELEECEGTDKKMRYSIHLKCKEAKE